MPRVYVSAVMDVPVERAWAVLRDFNALPTYNASLFATSEIEDGLPADRIGCVRRFYTHDGSMIREQLLSLSDRDRSCCYCILEVVGLPVRGYVSEVKIRTVTETGQTFGEWWADFDADPADMAECVARVSNTFRLGFQGTERVVRERR